MKRISISVVFVLLCLNLFGQYDDSKYYLSLGIGVVSSINQEINLFNLENNSTSLRPISISFEMPVNSYWDHEIADHLMVGVIFGFGIKKREVNLVSGLEEYRTTMLSALFRMNYSLGEKNKVIPYFGFQLGNTYYRVRFTSDTVNQTLLDNESTDNLSASGVYFGVKFGGYDSKVNTFIELGTSISLLSVGLNIAI